MSLALAGRLSTTRPPGKPPCSVSSVLFAVCSCNQRGCISHFCVLPLLSFSVCLGASLCMTLRIFWSYQGINHVTFTYFSFLSFCFQPSFVQQAKKRIPIYLMPPVNWYWTRYLTHVTSFNFFHSNVSASIPTDFLQILQMRKSRFLEVRTFSQGHRVRK